MEQGFVVDWRPAGGIRISPHFYNSDEEWRAIMEGRPSASCGPRAACARSPRAPAPTEPQSPATLAELDTA